MRLCEYNEYIEKKGNRMEKIRKKADFLGRIKWLGLILGIFMYYATVDAFGDIVSTILGCIAATSFYIICENERKTMICRHVSQQLRGVLQKIGQRESVFEIKASSTGFVIRVYLIRAGERAPLCTKALLDSIANSWYRSRVWATQIVDVDEPEEIPDAQKMLNDELFEDLKKNKD